MLLEENLVRILLNKTVRIRPHQLSPHRAHNRIFH